MKKLDQNVIWQFFLQYLIGLFIFIIFSSFCVVPFFFSTLITLDNPFSSSLGLILLVVSCLTVPLTIALAYFFAKLTYNNFFYELREDGFYKESGVITKKYVTIPYERIQNIDIYRGIIARMLGLSDLQIQTAGMSAVMTRNGAYGMGAEGRLPGLSQTDAIEIRNELVKRAQGKKAEKSGL